MKGTMTERSPGTWRLRVYIAGDPATGRPRPTTVHHLHGVLSTALTQAVKCGMIATAVTQRSSPPPLRSKPKELPSPQLIQQLISAADEMGQPILAAAIAIASTTGMRRGELLGLGWGDIDTERATLHVRRVIKTRRRPRVGHRTAQDPPGADHRIGLIHHGRSHPAPGRSRDVGPEASAPLDPEGYVLAFDPSGRQPMKPDSFGQAFARLCIAENIKQV
jgi:integrase